MGILDTLKLYDLLSFIAYPREREVIETLRQIKFDLIRFHSDYDHKDAKAKLEGLIEMQTKKYLFKNRISLADRREQFNSNMRNKRFFKRLCYVCEAMPVIRHHIISLKQGGTNAKRNIVALCKRDHAYIHPWLRA